MDDALNQVKQFWDSRPCNLRHSNASFGSIQYFNEVESRKYFVEPHIPKFAEFARWNGKRVLEVGCGIGTDAVNFVRHGADYTGIELSSKSLEIARQRFDVFGLKGRLIEGNAELVHNYLKGETFDLIYSFGVLHHTPSISNALTSIRKLCHQDTNFKLMVYAKNSWKYAMIRGGFDQPEAQSGCPIANVYLPEEIVELLRLNGFSMKRISQDHIFPYNVEKYVNFEYVQEPWFTHMPNELFRSLEKFLGWHLLVEAKPAAEI